MGERVIAEVVVRAPDGSSVLDASGPVTEETIGRYRPSVEASAEAAARLEAMGFEVVGRGPTGLTVAAEEEVFTRAFGAGDEYAVPADLADLVAGVLRPEQPELFP
jgi:hypothetical protein